MFIIALFKINKTQTIRENVLRKSERVVGSFMVVTLVWQRCSTFKGYIVLVFWLQNS